MIFLSSNNKQKFTIIIVILGEEVTHMVKGRLQMRFFRGGGGGGGGRASALEAPMNRFRRLGGGE